MKNSELDQILKSAPVPDRPGAYWDQFPQRVMAKTNWLRTRADDGANHPRTEPFWLRSRFRLATVGLGLAIIGLLLGFVLGFRQGRNLSITDPQLAAARKYFQEIETLFPGQVQAIVFDQQGPHLVLAERSNVPTASPLYLRICGPNGCQDYVTFSGQQIRFNGETCEVLLDRQGNVLLVGQQWVLSSAQASAKNARYQVAARPLELTL
jgi:hypothetical protein